MYSVLPQCYSLVNWKELFQADSQKWRRPHLCVGSYTFHSLGLFDLGILVEDDYLVVAVAKHLKGFVLSDRSSPHTSPELSSRVLHLVHIVSLQCVLSITCDAISLFDLPTLKLLRTWPFSSGLHVGPRRLKVAVCGTKALVVHSFGVVLLDLLSTEPLMQWTFGLVTCVALSETAVVICMPNWLYVYRNAPGYEELVSRRVDGTVVRADFLRYFILLSTYEGHELAVRVYSVEQDRFVSYLPDRIVSIHHESNTVFVCESRACTILRCFLSTGGLFTPVQILRDKTSSLSFLDSFDLPVIEDTLLVPAVDRSYKHGLLVFPLIRSPDASISLQTHGPLVVHRTPAQTQAFVTAGNGVGFVTDEHLTGISRVSTLVMLTPTEEAPSRVKFTI